jgi:hypothetical protein
MVELLKETKVWRVSNEDDAIKMIEDYKNQGGFTVTKGGYVIKTKKSKGEIVDMWCVVTIEFSYEV